MESNPMMGFLPILLIIVVFIVVYKLISFFDRLINGKK